MTFTSGISCNMALVPLRVAVEMAFVYSEGEWFVCLFVCWFKLLSLIGLAN